MPSEDRRPFTYQTRLILNEAEEAILSNYAAIFSHIERKLFKDISAGRIASNLKSEFLEKYRITARQFNAIRVTVEGKIASIKERQSGLIVETGYKIKNVEKTIRVLEKQARNDQKLHQKKRFLFNLQHKHETLKSDQEAGKVRLCFGSTKLFSAQFSLETNGYKNHEEWLEDWQKARNSSFFLMGSKDESQGNQSCTATIAPDGSLSLRVRLPDCMAAGYGKYLVLNHVYFKYGHREVIEAIQSFEKRRALHKLKDPSYVHYGVPISYRFKRDEKGWRVFATVPKVALPQTSSAIERGVIGIDVNANHLAVTELDRFGNAISYQTIQLNTYGKNQNQTKALIGDACALIVEQAKEWGKPIVIEDLNFQKKKQELKEKATSAHARMLSGLAYSTIKNYLKGRAWRRGVRIGEVNPAFTSVIGRVKFAKRYGLSVHHAAALAIGRRYLRFSERVPRHLEAIPDGKDGYVALSLPARNRDEHVWSTWGKIGRKLKTVLAAHFRAKRIRSSCSKERVRHISEITGGIPVRESSTQLLG